MYGIPFGIHWNGGTYGTKTTERHLPPFAKATVDTQDAQVTLVGHDSRFGGGFQTHSPGTGD